MAGGRRLAGVLVLVAALLGAAALTPPAADDSSAAPRHAHGAVLQPAKAPPGLVPGARAVDERMSLVVVAVLAIVLGVGAGRRRFSRRDRRRKGLAGGRAWGVRLRAPPTLQLA